MERTHTHIMLTMRAIDENGKWLPKSRKVYELDEHGNRTALDAFSFSPPHNSQNNESVFNG